MKKVFIRVDAFKEIGIGHLVRCLALGQMLKEHFYVHFICQKREEKSLKLIQEQQFDLTLIKAQDHALEIEILKDIITKNDFVVLDGYNFDLDYQQRIKPLVDKLIYIDDLNQFKVIADLLINHNFHAEMEIYNYKNSRLLLGPKYLLLRSEFLHADIYARQNIKIDSILICMGGADRENFTKKCAEGLATFFKGKISLVIGPAYDYEDDLINFAKAKEMTVHKSLSAASLISSIQNHDLLICTSSMIAAEAASIGTPMILGYMERNQEKVCEYFEKNDMAISLGNFMSIDDWSTSLKKTIQKINLRLNIVNQLKFIDRSSKDRIINEFMSLFLKDINLSVKRFTLRNLSIDDVTDQYVSWFEDSQTKRFIMTAEKFNSKQKLKAYVEEKIRSPNVLFLGIFDKKLNKHIGNIKFEPIDWIRSYTIMGILIGEKNYRGIGVAGEVLLECAKFFKGLGLKKMALGVQNNNHQAIRSYEKVGFKISPGHLIKFKTEDHSVEMILELKNV